MIRSLCFVAFELALPGVVIVAGLTVAARGNVRLAWLASILALAVWAASLALLVSTALRTGRVGGWVWAVALAAPSAGALWLASLARRAIGSLQPDTN